MHDNNGGAAVMTQTVNKSDTGREPKGASGPTKEKTAMATSGVAFNSGSCTAAAMAYDDMALVQACKEGNTAAFEQLVKRYDTKLFRIAQHITHNREDAQDAVQDAFLKAFRNLTQFRGNSQFSTWLTRIAVNESLMKLRKQRHSKEFSIDDGFQSEDDSPASQLADWSPNPEELYRGSELRTILRNELQELPPGLRVVFILRDIEGLTTEEAAEVIESTAVAVKARLWRARVKLREALSKYFGVAVKRA
jgi:RNA polymerase sigma-70 factor (ECF subfamily)